MAEAKTKAPAMVKDVVCGKDVDPKEAMYSSSYSGQTYYFCSSDCKRRFDENPDAYVE